MTHAVSGFDLIGSHRALLGDELEREPESWFDTGSVRGALRGLVPPGWLPMASAVSLAGEIVGEGSLADIVAFIAQSGRSGTLLVASRTAVRALAVERGSLVGAATSCVSERLGEFVHYAMGIPRDELDEISVLAAIDGRRMGEVLVADGICGADAIDALARKRTEQIFYGALATQEGVFSFLDESLSLPRLSQGLPLVGLVMEAARLSDELKRHRQWVPSLDAVVRLGPNAAGACDATDQHHPANFPPELAGPLVRVLARCDGERTVAEIGRAAGLFEYELTAAVAHLVSVGLVTLGDGPEPDAAQDSTDSDRDSETRLMAVRPAARAGASRSSRSRSGASKRAV